MDVATRRLVILMLLSTTTVAATAAERRVTASERFPGADGKRVVVDTAGVDAELTALDVVDVEVVHELKISAVGAERAAGWLERHTPTITDGADELRIVVAPGSDGFLGLGHLTARARIVVRAPLGSLPDLTTTSGRISVRGDFPAARPLNLRTSSGRIQLRGGAHSVDIRSTSGDATLEVFRPLEQLFARTAAGRVELVGGARQVDVETASGAVRLADLSGPARVITTGGDITLDWVRLDDGHSVVVRSSSGTVRVTLPPDVRPRGRLTTTRGRIRSGFPGVVAGTGDAVELAGDGPEIQVETASGDIELMPATVGGEDPLAAEGTTPAT